MQIANIQRLSLGTLIGILSLIFGCRAFKGTPQKSLESEKPRSESWLNADIISSEKLPSQSHQALKEGSSQTENFKILSDLKADIRVKTSWKEGYCADVLVNNTGSTSVSGWTLVLDAGAAEIQQVWNLEVFREAERYFLKPNKAWAREIDAGRAVGNIGFCAKLPPGGKPAAVIELRS